MSDEQSLPRGYDQGVYLPAGLEPGDEIEVHVSRDQYSTKITATIGEATIIVEHSEAATELVPWLAAALPNILDAVASDIQEAT